ncbi:uncharacterized protein LOC122310016 [Carya illinoinensis]|uniref:uncharacterized protein LOC122310016 n=1 Tax=Carya illinoinensis TaxID=32201 RepID=UPI001C71EBD2|nr:uncharacterized protein LOC122310016 [Carya illinoinensis]
MDILRKVFMEEEVDLVSRIPISVSNAQDKLIWRCTKDGRFSVRSAYYLAGEMAAEQKGQSSQLRQKCDLWTRLWKLKVPSATHVWGYNQNCLQKLKVVDVPFKELVTELFDGLDEHSITVFAETAYMLWRRRNSYVFESKFLDPNALVKAANQKVIDFMEANKKIGEVRVAANQVQSYWCAPPDQFHKANLDASMDRAKCRIGIGVIIRDWKGKAMATLRCQRALFPDPVIAEALGALKAISLCQQLYINRVILEVDAKTVVDDINCGIEKWNSGGMIIQDIRHKLRLMEQWSVQYIQRSINVIAHLLAKDALKLSEESIVLEGIPSCIQASML